MDLPVIYGFDTTLAPTVAQAVRVPYRAGTSTATPPALGQVIAPTVVAASAATVPTLAYRATCDHIANINGVQLFVPSVGGIITPFRASSAAITAPTIASVRITLSVIPAGATLYLPALTGSGTTIGLPTIPVGSTTALPVGYVWLSSSIYSGGPPIISQAGLCGAPPPIAHWIEWTV